MKKEKNLYKNNNMSTWVLCRAPSHWTNTVQKSKWTRNVLHHFAHIRETYIYSTCLELWVLFNLTFAVHFFVLLFLLDFFFMLVWVLESHNVVVSPRPSWNSQVTQLWIGACILCFLVFIFLFSFFSFFFLRFCTHLSFATRSVNVTTRRTSLVRWYHRRGQCMYL